MHLQIKTSRGLPYVQGIQRRKGRARAMNLCPLSALNELINALMEIRDRPVSSPPLGTDQPTDSPAVAFGEPNPREPEGELPSVVSVPVASLAIETIGAIGSAID